MLEDAKWGTDDVRVRWDDEDESDYDEDESDSDSDSDEVSGIRWGFIENGVENIDIWDSATGEVLRTLEGQTDWVKSVAISPCGKYVISGSDDKTVKVVAL